MMTAVNVVKHATGGSEKMVGGGLFSFIKYESRAISIAATALMTGGAAFAVLS